jgi:hypothetical protein
VRHEGYYTNDRRNTKRTSEPQTVTNTSGKQQERCTPNSYTLPCLAKATASADRLSSRGPKIPSLTRASACQTQVHDGGGPQRRTGSPNSCRGPTQKNHALRSSVHNGLDWPVELP